jgi:hypothetical protein
MRQHWYYRAAAWAIKELSEWYYIRGILAWREQAFSEASEQWYKASILDPNNLNAAHWYWRAKEISDSNKKHCTSKRVGHERARS